jgi:chemotaxis protein CheX
MKNINIECFTSSIDNVIGSFSSHSVTFGEIKNLEKEFVGGDISVIMGLTGDCCGTAYLAMNSTAGQKITSSMLGGMDVTEIDDMVKSAVGEFCNMIMGGACCELSNKSIMVDITPPTVIVGEAVTFSNNMITLSIPFQNNDFGDLSFDLAIKE